MGGGGAEAALLKKVGKSMPSAYSYGLDMPCNWGKGILFGNMKFKALSVSQADLRRAFSPSFARMDIKGVGCRAAPR